MSCEKFRPEFVNLCSTAMIQRRDGGADSEVREVTSIELFRPITMTTTILRLFHRSLAKRLMALWPINKQQNAFKQRVWNRTKLGKCTCFITESHENLKPLCTAFLDIRKALDSVNQPSIQMACKRVGIPNMFLVAIQ